jgi:catechol 2,3-dioxygenase-like lactoylglutathione lyase family enzyme
MKRIWLVVAVAIMAIGSGFSAVRAVAAEMPQPRGSALNVSSLENSQKFYTEMMGLKVVSKMDVAEGTEILMSADGTMNSTLVVITNFGGPKAGKETYGRLIFNMADPKPFIQKIKDAGIAVQQAGPPDGSVGVYFFHDPDGYQIEVFKASPPKAN